MRSDGHYKFLLRDGRFCHLTLRSRSSYCARLERFNTSCAASIMSNAILSKRHLPTKKLISAELRHLSLLHISAASRSELQQNARMVYSRSSSITKEDFLGMY